MAVPSTPERARPLLITLATLAAAAAGGGAFAALGLPAAWLSGALIAVAALAIAGLPVKVSEPLRRATFLVLGMTMGSAVTPSTLAGMRLWPISLAVLALSVVATIAAATLYLRRAADWDAKTAFYASAPGALTSVLALAAQDQADVRRVAFAQTVRLFLLIAALPGTLAALGLVPAVPPPIGALAVGTLAIGYGGELVLVAVTGVAGGLLAERLRIPGGLVFGAMLASALLHGSGLVAAMIPTPVLIACFVALGAGIGARFGGVDLGMLRRFLLASLGSFAVASIVAVAFALLAATLSGEGIAKTIVAFAPGGLEAMTILAFAIGLDPAFVAAHHLARFLLIALFLPVAALMLFGAAPQRD
jgi:membrane AbrB-like protein